MNRARTETESFNEYRQNLKAEDRQQKAKLSGRMLWPASFGTAYKVTIAGKPYYQNMEHRKCLV